MERVVAFVGAGPFYGSLNGVRGRQLMNKSPVVAAPARCARKSCIVRMDTVGGALGDVKLVQEGENVEFVWKDPETGREMTLNSRQKEDLFVDAMYSYYAGKPLLQNDAFDVLKEDLLWQGSSVVMLSRDELRFMEAARAYAENSPIMSDDEYDELKKSLLTAGSPVALQREPKCSLVTQTCWSDCVEDRARQTVLFLPAAGIGALVWATLSYEFLGLDLSPVLSLIFGTPFIALFSFIVTNIVLPNPLILLGKCPSCGVDQRVYFGTIATIDGYGDKAEVQCTNCKANLSLEKSSRRFRLDTSFKN
mmetsp:Transcript_11223/g.20276  ORF Transcript_11223/g.20276 Transcript_11223/m.20276 type:complete len:307 (-) Transcript_11223:218-1138(-)